MNNKLTETERLILSNQFQILSLIDKEYEKDYKNLKKIVDIGIEGMYSHCFNGISSKTIPQNITSEVYDILDFYRICGYAINNSSLEGIEKIKFKGFDANNDSHYLIMSILVEDMGRYAENQGKCYNSHGASSISDYLKLVNKYKELNLLHERNINDGHIKQLIDCLN
jgi:uncharacterized protein